jgi:hypothetical protein
LQLQERKGEETVVRGRGAVLGGNWGGESGRVDLLLLDSMTTGAAQRACTFFKKKQCVAIIFVALKC